MLLLLQIAHVDRVLGVCLIHCIGTAAGFMESVRDKVGILGDHRQFFSPIFTKCSILVKDNRVKIWPPFTHFLKGP